MAPQAAVCSGEPEETFQVYDLDSRLEFGSSFDVYAMLTFQPDVQREPERRPYFRVVSAETYTRAFASDRTHMRKADGGWKRPPPTWPPIVSKDGCTNTLPSFLNMGRPRPEPSDAGLVLDGLDVNVQGNGYFHCPDDGLRLRNWRKAALKAARSRDFGVLL